MHTDHDPKAVCVCVDISVYVCVFVLWLCDGNRSVKERWPKVLILGREGETAEECFKKIEECQRLSFFSSLANWTKAAWEKRQGLWNSTNLVWIPVLPLSGCVVLEKLILVNYSCVFKTQRITLSLQDKCNKISTWKEACMVLAQQHSYQGKVHECFPVLAMKAYCDCGVLIYILELQNKWEELFNVLTSAHKLFATKTPPQRNLARLILKSYGPCILTSKESLLVSHFLNHTAGNSMIPCVHGAFQSFILGLLSTWFLFP